MTEFNLDQFLENGAILSESPNRIWVGWGRPDRRKTPGHFYAPDFFLEDQSPWWSFPHFKCVDLHFLLHEIEKSQALAQPRIFWTSPSEAAFKKQFDSLIPLFEKGLLSKAVPAIYQEGEIKEMGFVRLLEKALKSLFDWPQFVYGLWNSSSGVFGVSPEVLLQKTDNLGQTMALAGTRGKEEGENSLSLLNRKKERREHELVVQGILLDLCRLEASDLSVDQTKEIELRHLFHLKTDIRFQTSTPMESLIMALHPTAALGAYPKESGRHWLEANRMKDRFGAPFGVSHDKESFCIVGIRNLQWDQKSIRIGAGCGVIPESEFEKEWFEIQKKLHAVRSVFEI